MPAAVGSEAAAGGKGGSRRNPRQAAERVVLKMGETGRRGRGNGGRRYDSGGRNRFVFRMALSVWAKRAMR